jgi:hypothetical protein
VRGGGRWGTGCWLRCSSSKVKLRNTAFHHFSVPRLELQYSKYAFLRWWAGLIEAFTP